MALLAVTPRRGVASERRWPRVSRSVAVPLVAVAVVLLIYHRWFMPGYLTWGDWGFLTMPHLLDFWPLPSLWNASRTTGTMDIISGPMYPQLALDGWLAKVGIGFAGSERLIWLFPAVILACIGGYVLTYSLFHNRLAAVIAGLYAVTNSYIALIDAGGQYTVGVAFTMTALVLWAFRSAVHTGNRSRYILTALFLSVQVMYDLRATYIAAWMLVLYVPFLLVDRGPVVGVGRVLGRMVLQALVCFIVVPLIHLYWLLPSVLVKAPALPQSYESTAGLSSLAFMRLANGVALMHPFWPLDKLGHLTPLDPVFFGLSLLVFVLLLNRRLSADALYLYVMAVLAIFLVKSVNPPGGGAYTWLFVHLPGFSMYRDASKFYQPLMVSVGALLGLVAVAGLRWVCQHPGTVNARLGGGVWIVLCFAAVLYPARPTITGELQQNLVPRPLPADYARFNAMIDGQKDYFRTLWLPAVERFGTYSERHPALDGYAIGTQYFARQSPDANMFTSSWLRLPGATNVLQALSVKYVVVPSDPLHEFFSTRTGQANLGMSQATQVAVARRYLRGYQEITFGGIHVFVNPRFLPEVYVPSRVIQVHPAGVTPSISTMQLMGRPGRSQPALAATVEQERLAPASHVASPQATPRLQVHALGLGQIGISVQAARKPFTLVFLQAYDPHWQAYILPKGAAPGWLSLRRAAPLGDHLRADGYANAWRITQTGSYTLVLEYAPQRLVIAGALVSALTLLMCLGYLALRTGRGFVGRRRSAPVGFSGGAV